MARYSERDTSAIYAIAEKWQTLCVSEGKSLLWSGEDVWTEENLTEFKKHFTDKPDISQRGFEEKFREQLEPAPAAVTKLACELILIYFLFPSNVSGNRKRELIHEIALWKNITIDDQGNKLLSNLDVGIGGTGQAYNMRRPLEIQFLGNVALKLVSLPQGEREGVLSDHFRLRQLLDEIKGDTSLAGRDTLLNLLFPDHYERIASQSHKLLIADAFAEVLEPGKNPEGLDDKLLTIRTKLEQLLPEQKLDFYWPPLRECWYVAAEEDDLNPLQGLSIKRQIVLYGPPGTSKTYEARDLADRLIRKHLLRAWGPKRYFSDVEAANKRVADRIRRVQFHPGYAYEDLVRGLQLTGAGQTEYKDGILLRIITEINADSPDEQSIPFVLILDEMNRADLSKVLGECFSLLEDRDKPVQLAGQDEVPREISIPPKLHIIGTMNLIDQSLEQVDFALRRRFLWFPRGFIRERFLEISRWRWDVLRTNKRLKKEWEKFGPEFEILAERAERINQEIEKHPSLGPQYQIGHTYFSDVVYFIEKDLANFPGRQRVLYGQNGQGREQTIGVLWKYSLGPLLEQYLSGIDTAERQAFLNKTKDLFFRGVTK